MIGVGFSIDQDEIGFDVAVAMIRPFSGKRMIVVAVRQRYISSEQIDDLHQDSIKGFAVPP
jgi:hypothetical protein